MRHTFTHILMITLTMMLLASIADAATIRLHREAGSSGPAVRLDQIAELTGAAAEALGAIEVATFEEGDREVEVSTDQIRRSLDRADANWADLSLTGFLTVTVYRTPSEDLTDAAGQDAAVPVFEMPSPAQPIATAVNSDSTFDVTAPATLYDLLVRKLSQQTHVPVKDLVVTLHPRDRAYLKTQIIGHRYMVDLEDVAGGWKARFTKQALDVRDRPKEIHFRVSQMAPVLVTRRPLQRGEVLHAEDFRLERAEVSLDLGLYFTNASELNGFLAGNALAEGHPVVMNDLVAEELIRRNDMVTVICRIGTLRIEQIAQARQSGGLGDPIELRNPTSGETFYAKVIARKRALIESPGSLAQGAQR